MQVVEVDRGVVLLGSGVEHQPVVALRRVHREHRQVRHGGYAQELDVGLAGQRLQEHGLRVAHEELLGSVEVGQLLPRGVDLEIVGVGHIAGQRGTALVEREEGTEAGPLGVRAVGVVLRVEQLDPGLELRVRDLLVQLILLRIGGMELLQVVRGQEGLGGVGQREGLDDQPVGILERPAHGVLVDHRELRQLAAGLPAGVDDRRDLGVVDDIVPEEREVRGGERLAVAPPHALAQVEGQRARIVGELVVLDEVRPVRAQVVVRGEQTLVDLGVDLQGEGSQLGEAPRAAVLAHGFRGLDDQHVVTARQALLERRELSGLHFRGQLGRLAEHELLAARLLPGRDGEQLAVLVAGRGRRCGGSGLCASRLGTRGSEEQRRGGETEDQKTDHQMLHGPSLWIS